MVPQFAVTQQNRQKYVREGFYYVKDRVSSDGKFIYWRCSMKRHGCKGRIHTSAGPECAFLRMVSGHSCIAVMAATGKMGGRQRRARERPSGGGTDNNPSQLKQPKDEPPAEVSTAFAGAVSEQRHEKEMATDALVPPLPDSITKVLTEAALSAQKNAYAPYSKFHVGAAILMQNGEIFKGANVENASYGGTICAERSAIVAAMSALGPVNFRPTAIAIVANLDEPAAPCGICRQMLAEFGDYSVLLLSGTSEKLTRTSVRQLLPMAFTPGHLEEFNSGGGNKQNEKE